MFQKILYINSPQNDYLSDSMLIGLKQMFGKRLVEYTVNRYIYKQANANHATLHGIGFTLYNLLHADTAVAFTEGMALESFDLFIFGDIYRQGTIYLRLKKQLTLSNTILLDGEDTAATFPYYYAPWKKPYSIAFPRLHATHIYFKRELIADRALYYLTYKLMPSSLRKHMQLPSNIQPISFSIPSEKIIEQPVSKTKLFGKHIVDEEVAAQIPDAMTRYAFDDEQSYCADLQHAKYGITTKRGGWDCLRHYEIAANASVICFRNLHLKPHSCAPHGLVDGVNCIAYTSYTDLMQKIENVTDEEYTRLQQNSLAWVRSKSCANVAKEMLATFKALTVEKA